MKDIQTRVIKRDCESGRRSTVRSACVDGDDMLTFQTPSCRGSALRAGAVYLMLALASGSLAAALSGQAAAQSSRSQDEEFGEGLEPFEAQGPLIAVVSLRNQKINVWDRNGHVAASRVSTGRKGHETPEGVFSIIERKVEHNSNLYDDAEMPFMQRITWSGVALHEGHVPNYRASHGCIRLPNEFAERLFRTTSIATRVVIVSHDTQPLAISHPVLPQPGMPLPMTPMPPADGGRDDDAAGSADAMVGTTGGTLVPTAAHSTLPRLVDLRREREELKIRLGQTFGKLRELNRSVRPLMIAANRAEATADKADKRVKDTTEWVRDTREAFERAQDNQKENTLWNKHIEALMALAWVKGEAAQARERAAEKMAAALSAKDAAEALEAERTRMVNRRAKLWRQSQPVTILVSRETAKIYVRRAFHPVLEVPAIIKNDSSPIGTHVFTALESEGEDGKLSWRGLTLEMPGGGAPPALEDDEDERKGRKRGSRNAGSGSSDPLVAARVALDRIELTSEVLAKVIPSLQPGSTVIVSDLGPSIETGPGTDIVVQTKGEEAAAANIAKWLAKQKAERLAEDDGSWRSGGSSQRRRTGDWQRW